MVGDGRLMMQGYECMKQAGRLDGALQSFFAFNSFSHSRTD